MFVERVTVAAEGAPADFEGPEVLLADGEQVFGERLGGLHQERGVGADAITVTAAEEPADGLAGGFAEDVPEGDVDAADGVGEGAAASHPEGVGVEFFGDALGFEGVLAEEERFEDAERAFDEGVVGEDGTPAGDAFVGRDGE